jgi:putative transposase
MRKSYYTDLSDKEWMSLKAHLPKSKLPSRLRVHSLREIFDAIFYVVRSGYPWRLLPVDFPPWQTVFYHFRRFRLIGLWFLILKALRATERKRTGKDPNPSAAIMDSQSVKTTEEAASRNGYDAHKHIKGRKRHLLVDTLGLPLAVYVTPADVQDRIGARCLLAGLKPLAPRPKKIWADGAYGGEKLAKWCQERGGWELEVVERDRESSNFQIMPKRWIVERSIAWACRNRRLAKDYERMVQTSETLIEVAMIRLIVRRLARVQLEPHTH